MTDTETPQPIDPAVLEYLTRRNERLQTENERLHLVRNELAEAETKIELMERKLDSLRYDSGFSSSILATGGFAVGYAISSFGSDDGTAFLLLGAGVITIVLALWSKYWR